MVRHRPPPDCVLLSRRNRRHHIFHPPVAEGFHAQHAAASRESRPGSRDRHEYPVPALLDAVRHAPRLVDQQTYVNALR